MAEFLATPLGTFLLIVVQGLGVIAFVMISLLFLVYGDRKIWAAVQMRRGPNVVGAFGILQSVADARITSYNVCYTKLLREAFLERAKTNDY